MVGDKDNQHQSYAVDTPDLDWADEWDDEVDVDIPDLEDIDDDIDIDVPTAPVAAQDDAAVADMAEADIDIDIPTPQVVDNTADTVVPAEAAEDVADVEPTTQIEDEPVNDTPVEGDIDTVDEHVADNADVTEIPAQRDTDNTPAVVDDAADGNVVDTAVAAENNDAPIDTDSDNTLDNASDIAAQSDINSDNIDNAAATPADETVDSTTSDADNAPAVVDNTVDSPVENNEPVVEDTAQDNAVTDTTDSPAEPVDDTADTEEVEIPDEATAKTAEQLAQEEEQLEQYRSQMGETTAELADVSEYKNFRKQTKSAGRDKSKNKTSDFDIFANRYKAKTLNAAVAATDPIVYFYNACLRANGTVMLFNVYQVLQDRFVGKLIPQLFTSVAEASSKIEELNLANLLAQLSVCAEYPQYDFVISVSARFFTKPAILEKLLRNVPDPVPSNLVMAFDCVSLQNIGVAAKTGLGALKERGIKVLLDNTERVSMTSLTDLDYDYIRVDSRYYEMGNPRAESFLRLILDMAKEQGVGTIATYCDNEDMAEYMLYMGVDAVQGNACSRPMRTVPNAIKAITLLQSMLES